MSKKQYEFVPIYKCRKCKEKVGTMGEAYFADKEKDGYFISQEDALEQIECYSSKTRIHKSCGGVCEIIRFDRRFS